MGTKEKQKNGLILMVHRVNFKLHGQGCMNRHKIMEGGDYIG